MSPLRKESMETKPSREHEYAMYRLDDCLGTGTAKELAKQWGVTREYIKYMSSPAHLRRMLKSKKQPSRARYVVKLGLLT